MCQHEQKKCPCCQQHFECKVGSILLCHCSAIVLTDAEQGFIKNKYNDCLCKNCLQQIKTTFKQHKEKI
jgi:Cysteine-rich CWC